MSKEQKKSQNPREEIGKIPDTELVKRLLIENYGYAPDLMYQIKGNHQKVYARKPCSLKIKSDGWLYFGRVESDGIRLSIEGSFLVGPKATKKVVELDDERAKRYLSGESVEIEDKELHGWMIVKWRDYFLGSAKAKDGRLINYVSKERRLRLE